MTLRMDQKYTRGQLADMVGISEKFLYEIEMKDKGFSAKVLIKIAESLEVSLDYIMLGKGSKKFEEEVAATIELFKPGSLELISKLLNIVYEIVKYSK